MSLSYGHLTSVAIKGIQEQQQQITTLIDLLGTDVSSLAVVEDEQNLIQTTIMSRINALEASMAALNAAATPATVLGTTVNAPEVIDPETSPIFSPALVSNGVLTIEDNVEIIGTLEVHADVTLYASLVVDTIHVAQALNVYGDTTLFGNLAVKGELKVSARQAGYATIAQGEKTITVTFKGEDGSDKPLTAIPVVTASVTNGFTLYQVKDVTTDGFTIAIPEAATADLTFSWTALAVGDLGGLPQQGVIQGATTTTPDTTVTD